jgi:hypothetical protein
MLPTNFVVTSTNLVQATTYSDFNNYLGHFQYQDITSPYFSIFVGRNNINPDGASVNIDDVAINVCYNHYPCPDDSTEYCWCGDRRTDSYEECDPSDSSHTHPYPTTTSSTKQYGCSPITCKHKLGGYCGDNIVQSEYGELCDNTSGTANTSTNSSANQYYCYRNISTLRCVSSTGGWCGDGVVTGNPVVWDNTWIRCNTNEKCDYNSNPPYSRTPASSNPYNQYECHTSTACTTTGGWCGDGIVQPSHGESRECEDLNSKCCFQNTNYGTIRVLNCTTTNSFCGDHNEDYYQWPSCFEECDYEDGYHPPPGSTSQAVQYECTPPSFPRNNPGECRDSGGYCGDGILQDTYDEQCDYIVTTTSAVNWSTSTEYCDENCQKKTIQAADGPEWTTVPGNSTLGTSDFQVMKYQAYILGHSGTNNHVAINCRTSTNNCVLTTPPDNNHTSKIAQVTRPMAKDMCAAIGAHLITNEEWMTIVKNVENVGTNWSRGTVPHDYLKTMDSPDFILSNGETISNLANDNTEHINSSIDTRNGEWPTSSYYYGTDNQYNWYPYNAIANWGTLDPNKFRPGYYYTTNETSSFDIGYGDIYLRKNLPAPQGQYCLLRNGKAVDINYQSRTGLLQLQFVQCSGSLAAFRCVKNTTTP